MTYLYTFALPIPFGRTTSLQPTNYDLRLLLMLQGGRVRGEMSAKERDVGSETGESAAGSEGMESVGQTID